MKDSFFQHGYAVARGLLRADEVKTIKDEFDGIADEPPRPGHFEPKTGAEAADDPLARYPRVLHPHRFSEVAREYLVHPGILRCLEVLMGDRPLAAQSMFYYKPPGARGQAMHQDNFYLPLLTETGEEVFIEANDSGGPCGKDWQSGLLWEGGTH